MRTIAALFVMLALLMPSRADAKSWTSVAKRVQASVMRVEGTNDQHERPDYCTAWMVAPGRALTAGHCVLEAWNDEEDDWTGDYTITVNGRAAHVIAYAKPNDSADIALLEFAPAKGDTPLVIAKDVPELGSEIAVFGSGYGFEYSGQFGYVQLPEESSSGMTCFNVNFYPGDSGGPVVDRKGHVVGLAILIYFEKSSPMAQFGVGLSVKQLHKFVAETKGQ